LERYKSQRKILNDTVSLILSVSVCDGPTPEMVGCNRRWKKGAIFMYYIFIFPVIAGGRLHLHILIQNGKIIEFGGSK